MLKILHQQRRRQNRSCDSCRKAKRACNPPLVDLSVGEDQRQDASAISYLRLPGTPSLVFAGPCSNCLKRRKECTFEWATSRTRRDNEKTSNPKPHWFGVPNGYGSDDILSGEPRGSRGFQDVDDTTEWSLPSPSPQQACGQQDISIPGPSSSQEASDAELSWLGSCSPTLPTGSSPGIYVGNWSSSDEIAKRHTGATLNCYLLRIYHDSLENALSCVLTERNCPYTNYFYHAAAGSATMPPLTVGTDWGPTWTNRIVSQVCRADRACTKLRGRTLTTTEEHAVSKALHLTIMSFAMQWEARQDRSHPMRQDTEATMLPPSAPSGSFLSVAQNYRKEAFHALQECAHIESLRVVFAFLLSSLVNTPLDGNNAHLVASTLGTDTSEGIKAIETLLDSDISPFLVETGARQLFSLRYKLKRLQRKAAGKSHAQRDCHHDSSESSNAAPDNPCNRPDTSLMSAEDIEIFQLLSWLAVIVDTVTAAIYGRPPIISDEDSTVSLHVQTKTGVGMCDAAVYQPAKRNTVSVWGDLFFHSGSQTCNFPPQVWPCSYERAAAVISDSAPVKLLLFRRLTRLQTLLYRGAEATQLENAIKDTIRLLRFWNHTYSPFVKEFMAHHGELAPRLQSWYVMIVGHWHLGVIIFANLIEEIDDVRLGLEDQRAERESSHYAYHLRKESSIAASDLAVLSLNESSRSTNEGQGFHKVFQGIGASVLLIEPWSNLFIRLFIHAAVTFYDEVSESRDDSHDFLTTGPDLRNDSLWRCRICTDALRCLGKISDVAHVAARTLSEGLEKAVLRQCLMEIERSNLGA